MALASFCRKSDEHTEDGKYGDLHALLLARPLRRKRSSTFSDESPADPRYSRRIFKFTARKKR
jgi:hypothetical protein